MREYLFRGKRVVNGEWLFGGFHSRFDRAFIIGCSKSFRIDGMDVIPETVGQFTGRRDKNFKMVFEHDILQLYTVWEDGTVDKYAVAVVLFSTHDQAYVLCCGNDLNVRYDDFGNYGRPEYYEVIGNIHDNPELLEGA